MPQNIGWIEIGIRLNNQLTKELDSVMTQLGKIQQNFGKSMGDLGGNQIMVAGKSWKGFTATMQEGNNAISSFSTNFNQGTKSVISAAGRMETGVKKPVQSLGKTLVSQFFDIQTIASQVVHYITFSFGVQMVRMLENTISGIITSVKDFDKAITNTATVSGYVGASFDDAREKIANLALEIGKNTIYSATQAAEALYTLAQAGYDVTKVTSDELIPILNYATATNISLSDAMQDVITVMKQFKLSFEDTTAIVDTFTATVNSTFASAETLRDAFRYTGQIAGSLGQNFQELAATIGVLADRGYEGGTAGQRLNQIFTQLLRPTEQGERALEGLGVTVADLNPYTNSLVEILYKLRDANFSATDSATLFRARTAGAMITLVNEVDAITSLNREIKLSAGITQTFADKQMTTMSASMDRLKNTTEAASLELRTSLVPVVNFLSNTLRGTVVPGIEGFANALKIIVDVARPFKSIFQALLSVLVAIGPALLLVAVSAATLSYILPKVGGAAIISATGVTSLNLALRSLILNIALVAIPLQGLAMIFPNYANEINILTISIIALAVALKFHLWTTLKATVFTMKTAIVTSTIFAAVTGGLASLAATLRFAWYAATVSMEGYTIAARIATVATALLSTIMKTLIIFAVIEALIWLAQNWNNVTKAIGDFANGVTDTIGITKKQGVLTEEQTDKLSDLEIAIKDVTVAEQERLKAQQDINEMTVQGIIDTEGYAAAMERLGNANADYNVKSTKVLELSAELIQSIRGYSEELDKTISTTGEYNTLLREKETLESGNLRLADSQTKILEEYNQAILEEGINSDKAAQIYEQYIQISGEKVENDRRLIELVKELDEKEKVLADDTSKLNTADKERLSIVNQIIGIQEELLETYDEIAEVQAQISRLQRIDVNLIKLLAEQNKNLWEKKLKLLDAEEKLAKLRASEPRLLDDIFNALADQGLLTDEIIDAYMRLQEAQGELMGSRIAYFEVMSGLSTEERALVDAAIVKYKELRDSGMSADEAFQQAFGGLIALIPSLDLSELEIIGDYAEDLWEMGDATKDLGDIFKDLIPVLKNLGLEDVITAIYEWLKLIPEIGKATEDVKDKLLEFNDALMDTVQIVADDWLASGVMKEFFNWLDKTTTLVPDTTATFEALAKKIPAVSYAIGVFNGNAEEMVGQLLSSVNGLDISKDSLDDYGSSILIATASIITMYTEQGNAITPTTTLDDMFKTLGIDAKTAWAGAVQGAQNFTTEGGKPKATLQQLIDTLGDSTKPNTLVGSLTNMTTKLDELIAKLNKPAPTAFFDAMLTVIGAVITKITGIRLPEFPTLPSWEEFLWGSDYVNKAGIGGGRTTGGTGGGTTGGGTVTPPSSYIPPVADTQKFNVVERLYKDLTPPMGLEVTSTSQTMKRFPALTVADVNALATQYALGTVLSWGKGGLTQGPQLSMIGEKGKETVIPLQGINKKYGRDLLEYIIPRYYPDLLQLQTGGIVGGSYDYSEHQNENYTITGPININSVANADDFANQLKYKMRSAK